MTFCRKYSKIDEYYIKFKLIYIGEKMINYLYIDTETTGLSQDDELLCVSILDDNDICLFHSLIKPRKHKTWESAMAVHGITPNMVRHAPYFSDIKRYLFDICREQDVVAYNMVFDSRFLNTVLKESRQHCCMNEYSKHVGIWIEEEHRYKRHKLIDAVCSINSDFKFVAHNSLEDCKATRLVWQFLKNYK